MRAKVKLSRSVATGFTAAFGTIVADIFQIDFSYAVICKRNDR